MANYTKEISHMLDRLNTKILSQDKEGYFKEKLKTKISLIDLMMIKQIGEHGEVRLNQLIKVLEVDRNLVTTTVKKLMSHKWIQKRVDAEDGRGQILSLLPAGVELYDEIIELQKKELAFILNDVTINEEKAILKFISKIVQYHTEKFEIKP